MSHDPYYELVPTAELTRLAAAMQLVDSHADLNRRYRRLVDDSQQQLAHEQVRLSQARGMAKKLMVLVKACGADLRDNLTDTERDTLDAGLTQADELVYHR